MKVSIYRGVDNHFRLLKEGRGGRVDISLEAMSDWDAHEMVAQIMHRHKLNEWKMNDYIGNPESEFKPI